MNTTQLKDTYLIKLKYLRKEFELELPSNASQHIEGTYLCLNNISEADFVVRVEPLEVEYYVKYGFLQERCQFDLEQIGRTTNREERRSRRSGTILKGMTAASVRHVSRMSKQLSKELGRNLKRLKPEQHTQEYVGTED